MTDVLVIGAGLSASTAALRLAAAGLRVSVAQAGWGATANFGGRLTLAASPSLTNRVPLASQPRADAQTRAAKWALADQVRDIVDHEPLHPYANLGDANTLRHLHAAVALLADVFAGCHLEAAGDAWAQAARPWPTASGALVPVWTSTSPWDAGGQGHKALDFAHAGVDLGRRAALGWDHDAGHWGLPPPQVQAVQVPKDLLHHAGVGIDGALALARAFDDGDWLEEFGQAMAPALQGATCVWLPPVAGVTHFAATLARLAERWQVPVRETLADAPSVPGIRLVQALAAARTAAGIAHVAAVHEVGMEGGKLVSVTLRDQQVVRPQACVLATGRFLSGGIAWPSQQRCREGLFHLPVSTDGGPITERSAMELTRRRPEDDQPLLRAGVACDGRLRPRGDDGQPLLNVWAAGMVLGGFGPQRTHCSDGVALTTGHAVAEDIVATFAAGTLHAGRAQEVR